MLIESVKFVDFGPFHGEHRLIFPDEGRGVHIIHGETGQGKTSILRGILWGLYGRVFDRSGDQIRPTSLLNRTAQRDGALRFGVVIQFNHDGEKWTLTRRMEARGFSDKSFDSGAKVTLVRGGEVVPNPDQAIGRILSEDVSKFFFFDGEMLQDYEELLDQSSHSMAILRDSIEHVLGVPVLKTARDDSIEVERTLERERTTLLRRLGGESLTRLADEFQAISQRITEHEQRMRDLETEMSKLEVEVTGKKRRLVEVSQIKTLAEERISLDREVDGLNTKREAALDRQRRLLGELYKTLVARSSEDIIEHLRQKHEAAMGRYNEKKMLQGQEKQVQEAIAASKCKLCGAILDAVKLRQLNGDLRELRDKIRALTDVPEPNLEYDEHVNRLEELRRHMVRASEFTTVEGEIAGVDHELGAKRARLSEVKEKLQDVDEDEPRRIATEIDALSAEKGRLKGLREGVESRRREDLERKAELDHKLQSVDQEGLEVLSRRIDATKPLAEIFEEAISRYRDEKRKEVEAAASDIFRQLRTKKSFSHLSINPQFGLNIITDDGQVLDRAEWRSSGEEQLVALSLIGALNHCAQIAAAVFMDTPFARLDLHHGERVLRYVPKLSEQVVLFVTGREFRPEDARSLAGSIKSEFTVSHMGEREGSVIAHTAA